MKVYDLLILEYKCLTVTSCYSLAISLVTLLIDYFIKANFYIGYYNSFVGSGSVKKTTKSQSISTLLSRVTAVTSLTCTK